MHKSAERLVEYIFGIALRNSTLILPSTGVPDVSIFARGPNKQ